MKPLCLLTDSKTLIVPLSCRMPHYHRTKKFEILIHQDFYVLLEAVYFLGNLLTVSRAVKERFENSDWTQAIF